LQPLGLTRDLHRATINVDTLNLPFFQAMPTLRANGKEVCFMAFRPEGFGGLDIWCAERLH
jgi:hypothetical protein